MAVFEKNGKWYIDYYHNGRRFRECAGTSKVLAKKALEARKGEIAQGRFGLSKSKKRVKFEEFSKDYLAFSKSYKRSYKRDTQHVGHLLEHFGDLYLEEISPLFIENYKAIRVNQVKPATVNRELACLKHMFSMAIRWQLATSNPVKEVKLFNEELPALRILSIEEQDRLINECSDRLKPIVITALNTGMRLGEILNMEWKHVDLDLRIITVTKTKTRENRIIPINSYLASILAKQPMIHQYVFPNKDGKPFNSIKKGFHAAAKRAAIGHFRFHDLRHNFASNLVMEGVDLVTVKELLGHKQITTTMRYAHLSNEHKRMALERLQLRYGHQMDTKMRIAKSGQS
jgi:integrase